eukprot:5167203-Heterocapsa_arctica.AAC.1
MTNDKTRYIAKSPKHQAWTVYCQVLGGKWIHGTRTTKEPRSFGETNADLMNKKDSPHDDTNLAVTSPQLENC